MGLFDRFKKKQAEDTYVQPEETVTETVEKDVPEREEKTDVPTKEHDVVFKYTQHIPKVTSGGLEYTEHEEVSANGKAKSSLRYDGSSATITVEVDAASVREVLKLVYPDYQRKLNVTGFRPGTVPMEIAEKMYGQVPGTQEAVSACVRDSLYEAAKAWDIESLISVFARPEMVGSLSWEKNEPLVYTVIYKKPKVKLGQYLGLEIPKTPDTCAVTDEEIMNIIAKETEREEVWKEITDRAAEKGDEAVVELTGLAEDLATVIIPAKDHTVVLGAGRFFNGFDGRIIGHCVGDVLHMKVTFPENYRQKAIAGKTVIFRVKLKNIYTGELPEIDDDFVIEHSNYDSLEEYKDHVRTAETAKRKAAAVSAKENAVLQKAIANAEIEVTDDMVDSELEDLMVGIKNDLEEKGMSLAWFLRMHNMTEEQLKEQKRPSALFSARTNLLLEEIARVENIQVTEEDYEAAYRETAPKYTMTPEELRNILKKEDLVHGIARNKALDLIVAGAKEI